MGSSQEFLHSISSKLYEKSTPTNSTSEFLFIGELAERLGLNPKTIRYYEREGLLKPTRHGKFRVYFNKDVRRLKVILAMRQLGVSIANIIALSDIEDGVESDGKIRKIFDVHLGILTKQLKITEDQLSMTRQVMEEIVGTVLSPT